MFKFVFCVGLLRNISINVSTTSYGGSRRECKRCTVLRCAIAISYVMYAAFCTRERNSGISRYVVWAIPIELPVKQIELASTVFTDVRTSKVETTRPNCKCRLEISSAQAVHTMNSPSSEGTRTTGHRALAQY